jgi:hypothetical protein
MEIKMAGILSKELAGISGSLAHPMRQISGSVVEVGGQPVTTGGGFTAVLQLNGFQIILDNGPTNEVLSVSACWSGDINEQGTTIRVANQSLTAPGGFIDFALGTAGADTPRVPTDRLDFTLMISGPFA